VRPWQHAFSSGGDDWADALAVHEFLDMSKAGCADRRHRIVLHHVDLGAALALQAFPDRADVSALVRRHVEEDLGRPATLADWLDGTDPARLPQPVARRLAGGEEAVCALVANRLHPGQARAVARVAAVLFAPRALYPADPDRALAVLMHSIGPAIVRRLLGPPVAEAVEGKRVVTDWGWIAEALIMACYGRIPDLAEITRCVEVEPVRAPAWARRAA
jgi:hypothetical protein